MPSIALTAMAAERIRFEFVMAAPIGMNSCLNLSQNLHIGKGPLVGHSRVLNRIWRSVTKKHETSELSPMSGSGPACVKTSVSQRCTELFSQFFSLDRS